MHRTPHQSTSTSTSIAAALSPLAGALLLALAGWASTTAAAAPAADADAAYQKEVAACKAGQTGEDQATCLKEAGAARDQAKRGLLESGSAYRAHALTRCKALQGDDRTDCEARIKGEGTTSGSVQGGGILRERVTTQVGTPASAPR